MDSISPLAKILAEANGIDWRSIQGSGTGGSIVEQDILNYLSRVMSGDEEPPATPVDEAPPGWTGEMPPMPAAVAASGLQALSAAGVDSDITDFVAQQSQSGHAQPQPVEAPPVQAVVEAPPVQAVVDAPSTTVYRPAEPVVPPVMGVQAPVVEFGPESPVQAAPVSPVSEFESGPDSDGEEDLEFELDDDLPDDEVPSETAQTAPELPTGSLTAPLQPATVVEPVVAAASTGPTSEFVQAVESPAFDPVMHDSEAEFLLADALPVGGSITASGVSEADEPSLTPSQAMTPAPEATTQSQDNRQGQGGVAEVATGATGFGLGGFLSRLYGSGAAAVPAAQPAEPREQAAVSESQVTPMQSFTPVTAPMVSAVAAPSDPVPAAESAPEVSTGTVHSEPYMPSFSPTPDFVSGTLDEPSPGSPLLGEPLISQAPPIPDTPVAAPLVADQWRDQPEPVEYADHVAQPTEEAQATQDAQAATSPDMSAPSAPAAATQRDPFMLGDAAAADQELISVESERAVSEELPAELGQHIALPEAHEGGLQQDLPALEPEPVQDAPVEPEPGQPGQNWTALVEPQAEQADGVAELPATTQPADAQPDATQSADSEPATRQPVIGHPVDVQPLTSQPGATQASTLRLNVNLSVLEAARVQLSEALYREVPLSLLVARAAYRSVASLGLSTSGGVALADHAGQPLATDLGGDFRASLDGLGQSAQTSAALMVLDAAELGLDELHRGECSLSVGRAEAGANVLSLRGDLDPVRGAKFLHEVAALLGTPILLLF